MQVQSHFAPIMSLTNLSEQLKINLKDYLKYIFELVSYLKNALPFNTTIQLINDSKF